MLESLDLWLYIDHKFPKDLAGQHQDRRHIVGTFVQSTKTYWVAAASVSLPVCISWNEQIGGLCCSFLCRTNTDVDPLAWLVVGLRGPESFVLLITCCWHHFLPCLCVDVRNASGSAPDKQLSAIEVYSCLRAREILKSLCCWDESQPIDGSNYWAWYCMGLCIAIRQLPTSTANPSKSFFFPVTNHPVFSRTWQFHRDTS